MPLLDLDIKVEKNNNTVVIYFPKHFVNKNVYVMIGKDLLHAQTNDHAQLIIKKKEYVKKILASGFELVDYDKM
jgi:hypothetical protein